MFGCFFASLFACMFTCYVFRASIREMINVAILWTANSPTKQKINKIAVFWMNYLGRAGRKITLLSLLGLLY